MAKLKKFVRKHPMPGVYGVVWKGKQIQIKNREIYTTADEKLIKLFKSDPEIMEFEIPKENKVKQYSDMTEQELLDLAKSRGLEKDDVIVKDTTIEGLITELKEWDEENSRPVNDPGEQSSE